MPATFLSRVISAPLQIVKQPLHFAFIRFLHAFHNGNQNKMNASGEIQTHEFRIKTDYANIHEATRTMS